MPGMAAMGSNATKPVLRTLFKNDLPRAFLYTNAQQESQICGPYAQTIANFAHYRNYRLELERISNFTIFDMYSGLESKEYNISLHGSIVSRRITEANFSYPVEWVKHCIMVPFGDELPKYLYIIWPFGANIWLSIIFGAIYVSILMRYIEYPKRDAVTRSITRNLLHSFAILMYCSNMNLRLRNAGARVLLFYTLLLVLGFILSALYFPYFVAYNMKPIFVDPINTLDDLLAAGITVYIPFDEYRQFNESAYVDLSRIASLVRNISRYHFLQLLESLNHSYAYVISQDQWNFIHKQQRQLKKPYFHLTKICYGSVFNAYPVQVNSTFLDSLDFFVLSVKQSGLWLYWEEQAFNMAVVAGYADVLLDSYPPQPLNLDFFRLAWFVLAFGLPLSFLIFFVETFLMKYKNDQTVYNVE